MFKKNPIPLQSIMLLLKQKYHLELGMVKGRNHSDNDKVCVILVNQHSVEVNDCNKAPIEFLKARGGIITQESHDNNDNLHYSVITLNKADLNTIIQDLNALPVQKNDLSQQMMARC